MSDKPVIKAGGEVEVKIDPAKLALLVSGTTDLAVALGIAKPKP